MLGDDADGDKESLGAGLLPYKQASLIWQVLGEKHSDDVAAAKKKLQGIVDKSIAVRGVTVPLSVEGSSEDVRPAPPHCRLPWGPTQIQRALLRLHQEKVVLVSDEDGRLITKGMMARASPKSKLERRRLERETWRA